MLTANIWTVQFSYVSGIAQLISWLGIHWYPDTCSVTNRVNWICVFATGLGVVLVTVRKLEHHPLSYCEARGQTSIRGKDFVGRRWSLGPVKQTRWGSARTLVTKTDHGGEDVRKVYYASLRATRGQQAEDGADVPWGPELTGTHSWCMSPHSPARLHNGSVGRPGKSP